MDKKNYRESLEKDRREITTDTNANLSRRTQRQSGKPTKEKKNLLLPALFFIFILIPVAILIFVAFVYEPDDTDFGASSDNEVSFETTPPEETPVLVPEEKEEEAVEETEPEEESERAEEVEESAEEPVEETVKQEAPPAETEQPVENTTPAPPETPAASTPDPPAATDSSSAKSVVVKANETLYRIAVNNYGASGAGAAVEKIKQANGLTSNEIFVGQTLILP